MPAVTRLTLTRFRNYRLMRLTATPQPVVLCGLNGAGKTNLLEALSFLSPGRGLRRARLDEIENGPPAAGQAQGWAVAATLDTATGPLELGTGCEPPPAKERRVVRIDGQPARGQTVLAEHLSLLWLTPQMDRLFVEGATGRRRFLDRLVFGFDPAHAGRLNRYEHALRERARLLRDGVRDDAWLGALENQMATTGVAVAAARREVAARLNIACAAGIGPFPQAELTVTGPLESDLNHQPALPVEDRMRARLREARRDDAESGGAVTGPHRGDFLIFYRKTLNTPPRPAESCSTGEQKALLLAIVLANARLLAAKPTGAPLLLLDEVAAHLDADRRAALFQEILALEAQAWLTGTDAALFAPLRHKAQFLAITDNQATMASNDG